MDASLRQKFTLRMPREAKDSVPLSIQWEMDDFAEKYTSRWEKFIDEDTDQVKWTGYAHPLFIAMNVAIIRGDYKEYEVAKAWLTAVHCLERN